MQDKYIKQLKRQNVILKIFIIVTLLINIVELCLLFWMFKKVRKFYWGRAFTFSYPYRYVKIDGKIYTSDDFVLHD